MRPKTTGKKLPPRMIERKRVRQSGKVWVAYFYNGRDDDGRRKEIPLGSDLAAAKRKWAELEATEVPVDASLMRYAFNEYEEKLLPKKGVNTQKEYRLCLKFLRAAFDDAPIDAIKPTDIARYRDSRSAPVRANREIALLSTIFNAAREWGFTARDNPCRGVRKNEESPRDYYAEPDVWDAVYKAGVAELQDAMDLSYLTSQRPADVRLMGEKHIRNDELHVRQAKTRKYLRIRLTVDGARTELGKLIDRLLAKPVRPLNGALLCTSAGVPISPKMLRDRFEDARTTAAGQADKDANFDLAERIRAFQFRDIRPKAASEIESLDDASSLLGHTNRAITKRVYRRTGERVNPTK